MFLLDILPQQHIRRFMDNDKSDIYQFQPADCRRMGHLILGRRFTYASRIPAPLHPFKLDRQIQMACIAHTASYPSTDDCHRYIHRDTDKEQRHTTIHIFPVLICCKTRQHKNATNIQPVNSHYKSTIIKYTTKKPRQLRMPRFFNHRTIIFKISFATGCDSLFSQAFYIQFNISQ